MLVPVLRRSLKPSYWLLTFDLEQQHGVLAAAAVLSNGEQVDAGILQLQLQQRQGAVGVRLHSPAVVGRHIGVRPLLPGGHDAAG